MRELLRAAFRRKPVVSMLETEKKHGALLPEAVLPLLQNLEESDAYERWGPGSHIVHSRTVR